MPQQSERDPGDRQVSALLRYQDRKFSFLLPAADDHISKAILSGSFYEAELLGFLKEFLGDGDLVLDVGANIGNHTVFFAGVCGCEVEAFEPNCLASHYLKTNISLNALVERVRVHELALSNEEGRLSVDVSVPGNLGATSFKSDEHGAVVATTVDSLEFQKRVALIKVDAEGMDALVLAGAQRLIKRDRPLIVAEAADAAAFDRLAGELKSGEYVAMGCFNATDTYAFAPSKTAAERALIARMEASGLLGLQHGLKALKKTVAANKLSLDKVAQLQRQLTSAVFGEVTPKNDLVPIQDKVEKLSGEAVFVSQELAALRDKLERQQSSMLEWLKQFGAVAYSAGDIGARLAHFSVDLSRVGDAAGAASQRAAAAEALGEGAIQASNGLSSKLDLLAGQVTELSKVASLGLQATKLAEDANHNIAGLHGQVDEIRAAVDDIGASVASQMEFHQSLDQRLQDYSAKSDTLRLQLDSVAQEVELSVASTGELAQRNSAAFLRISETVSEIEKSWAESSCEVEALRGILDELQVSVARDVNDIRHKLGVVMASQSAFSTDVDGLRKELALSAQASLQRTLQLKSELELGQREVLQKVVSEQARLSRGMEGIVSNTQRVNDRLDALLNGRIFSTLRALKRIGAVVRNPLRRLGTALRPIATEPEQGALIVPKISIGSIGAGPEVHDIPLFSPAPAKTARTEGAQRAAGELTTESRNELSVGFRCRTVTPGERADFKSQIDDVRAKMPAYMSRRVTADDLAFTRRPLRVNGLVSVVMTTFNTREYVDAAVTSILAQTHKNLELIVVDDGSTDGTREAVQAIAERDQRVKCISFGVNRGTYWCKNYGITRAKGAAVTFMDSDDVSEPDRLEKQYALLSNPGCAVTTCLHERRDLQGNLITVAGRTKRVAYISQMMRKGVFDVLGYFDSVRTSADDEMLRRIKRFMGVDAHRTVHEVLYHAVVRDASLTQDPGNRGLSTGPGGLSEPRKAYSEGVDTWHASVEKRGRTPYVPFPIVRRPFSVDERLLVAPGHLGDEIVSVCIASFPPRQKQLQQAFNSLIDQVDLVFVYLNQYQEVPEFLRHPRVIVKIGGENLRDNGKFYFTPAVPSGYCFTIDDDIVYPKDYIQSLIRKIELYGRKACVGLHGTVFAKPFVSYFGGRRVLHFRQSLDRDHVVDQLGTGTLAFHTSLWRPSCEAYSETGMVDAWVAVDARNRNIPLIAVERKKAWLTPISMPDGVPPSLFEEFKSSDDKQTSLVSSCSGWGVGMDGECRQYIEDRVAANGEAFGSQVSALQMIDAAEDCAGQRSPAIAQRELFKLAVIGRTNKERWKKGGILKSTHLTAEMLRPLGVEVALIDLETDDPRSLGGFDADLVMVYPGDPERPDFKDVISLVDHHALLGRAVLVNLSLNGRATRKQYICEQMAAWRALYGKRVALMAFGDRVEDDPALAPIADTIVAIPKTLQYHEVEPLSFADREGIFLGDYGKLCDETLLAWPVDEAIEALKAAVPEAHLFCVEQYRPKRKRDLGLDVLPFLGSEYGRVLSRSRLMISPVKFATFEMVPMEVAAMGVPVLHPKMDNSLSDYLGLGAVEVNSVEQLARCAKALYSDAAVWQGISDAGRMVARGLACENMAAQMYLRLLNFRKSALT